MCLVLLEKGHKFPTHINFMHFLWCSIIIRAEGLLQMMSLLNILINLDCWLKYRKYLYISSEQESYINKNYNSIVTYSFGCVSDISNFSSREKLLMDISLSVFFCLSKLFAFVSIWWERVSCGKSDAVILFLISVNCSFFFSADFVSGFESFSSIFCKRKHKIQITTWRIYKQQATMHR